MYLCPFLWSAYVWIVLLFIRGVFSDKAEKKWCINEKKSERRGWGASVNRVCL